MSAAGRGGCRVSGSSPPAAGAGEGSARPRTPLLPRTGARCGERKGKKRLVSKKRRFYCVKTKQTPEHSRPSPPRRSAASPASGMRPDVPDSPESTYRSVFKHLRNYKSFRGSPSHWKLNKQKKSIRREPFCGAQLGSTDPPAPLPLALAPRAKSTAWLIFEQRGVG